MGFVGLSGIYWAVLRCGRNLCVSQCVIGVGGYGAQVGGDLCCSTATATRADERCTGRGPSGYTSRVYPGRVAASLSEPRRVPQNLPPSHLCRKGGGKPVILKNIPKLVYFQYSWIFMGVSTSMAKNFVHHPSALLCNSASGPGQG